MWKNGTCSILLFVFFLCLLPVEFKDCYCTASDNTYIAGQLYFPFPSGIMSENENGCSDLFQTKFIVDEVEVWGTGDGGALRRQDEAQRRDESVGVN